jgi:hypothetical protein
VIRRRAVLTGRLGRHHDATPSSMRLRRRAGAWARCRPMEPMMSSAENSSWTWTERGCDLERRPFGLPGQAGVEVRVLKSPGGDFLRSTRASPAGGLMRLR